MDERTWSTSGHPYRRSARETKCPDRYEAESATTANKRAVKSEQEWLKELKRWPANTNSPVSKKVCEVCRDKRTELYVSRKNDGTDSWDLGTYMFDTYRGGKCPLCSDHLKMGKRMFDAWSGMKTGSDEEIKALPVLRSL